MESFVITWRELLIGVVLVLAVYIAEMLLLMRSTKSKGWRLWQRGAEASMQHRELQSLELEVSQLHEQITQLQAEMEKLKTVQQMSASPYSQAVQLAQQGLDVNEVALRCGISRGEAELIVAMHRTSPHDS